MEGDERLGWEIGGEVHAREKASERELIGPRSGDDGDVMIELQ